MKETVFQCFTNLVIGGNHMNDQLKNNLNGILANLFVMYMKLHHHHWFINGAHFYVLHEKFENFYDEITGYFDDIAERLLTLEEVPISTLKECLEYATIKEATGSLSEEQMIQQTIDDFLQINQQLLESLPIAAENGDEGTHDLLLSISKNLEKHVWMLRSFLGNNVVPNQNISSMTLLKKKRG